MTAQKAVPWSEVISLEDGLCRAARLTAALRDVGYFDGGDCDSVIRASDLSGVFAVLDETVRDLLQQWSAMCDAAREG